MSDKLPGLLELPPNRVRGNYHGGRVLDALGGKSVPVAGDRPENWLCSLTEALNPGMPVLENPSRIRSP